MIDAFVLLSNKSLLILDNFEKIYINVMREKEWMSLV